MDISKHAAIAALLSRYSWATDDDRYDDLEGCFAPDGSMRIEYHDGSAPIALRGATEIVSWIAARRSEQPRVRRRHMTSNLMIEEPHADGTVIAISYIMLLIISEGNIRVAAAGRYRDRIAERDGQFKILERLVTLDTASG